MVTVLADPVAYLNVRAADYDETEEMPIAYAILSNFQTVMADKVMLDSAYLG